PGHPSRVMLSVSVYVPPAMADTCTDAPVVDPMMMPPLPLINQLCVTVPPDGLTVEVCVLVVPTQNGPAGAMVHVGGGVTTKVAEQVLVQPNTSMTVAL